MSILLTRLWRDERGFIISAELAMIMTIVVIGGIVGLHAAAMSVNQELNDLSNSFGALDQSYSYMALRKACHAQMAGSSYIDTMDECDCTIITEVDGDWKIEDRNWGDGKVRLENGALLSTVYTPGAIVPYICPPDVGAGAAAGAGPYCPPGAMVPPAGAGAAGGVVIPGPGVPADGGVFCPPDGSAALSPRDEYPGSPAPACGCPVLPKAPCPACPPAAVPGQVPADSGMLIDPALQHGVQHGPIVAPSTIPFPHDGGTPPSGSFESSPPVDEQHHAPPSETPATLPMTEEPVNEM